MPVRFTRLALALALALPLLAGCAAAPAPEPEASRAAVFYPNETPELRGLIETYAKTYAVPEDLVQRVVVRESSHRPEARNGPYYGLMQILPQTARQMGYAGRPDGLLDAETNLKYAVKYLRGAWLVAEGGRMRRWAGMPAAITTRPRRRIFWRRRDCADTEPSGHTAVCLAEAGSGTRQAARRKRDDREGMRAGAGPGGQCDDGSGGLQGGAGGAESKRHRQGRDHRATVRYRKPDPAGRGQATAPEAADRGWRKTERRRRSARIPAWRPRPTMRQPSNWEEARRLNRRPARLAAVMPAIRH